MLGIAAKQRTSSGLQQWEAMLGGLTTFAEAAQLLETLAGVDAGIETLRTHAKPPVASSKASSAPREHRLRPPKNRQRTMRQSRMARPWWWRPMV